MSVTAWIKYRAERRRIRRAKTLAERIKCLPLVLSAPAVLRQLGLTYAPQTKGFIYDLFLYDSVKALAKKLITFKQEHADLKL